MLYRFADREEGGRALATKLAKYKDRRDTVVLALPHGGVPVGYEVAKALNLPLDVFLVRKLGVPSRDELAFGAIASGGTIVLNEQMIETFKIPDVLINKVIAKEKAELERRETLYRRNLPPLGLKNKTVILVDDGLATGATMRAALAAVHQLEPKQIIVAAPVASRQTCENIERKFNDLCICSITPEDFHSVGEWYRDFSQTRDEEVCRLLEKSKELKGTVNLKKAA